MNEPKTYNIFDVLNCCKITVPIIQRDYVQGIDTQEINEKRNKFLDYLCREDEKNLDFIYGYTENGKFIPIDGQQRLTTLFLMLIYGKIFKHNEENNKTSDEKCGQICNDRKQDLSTQNILKNFTYELRTSTREFLERLIDNLENLNFNDNPSKEIKNQSWFLGLWEKDPSISAMLHTLDDIHKKCMEDENCKKEENCNDVILNRVKKTKFRFWDLQKGGKFNDPEDVFIKMNSRGMPLTPFQEFKAWLNKELKGTAIDIPWQKEMDGKWMDFFWELAKAKIESKGDGKNGNKEDNKELLPEITERMFLKFINEVIFFYHKRNEENNEDKEKKDGDKKKEEQKEWREYILSNVDENFVFYQSQYEKVNEGVFESIFKLLDKITSKKNDEGLLAFIKAINKRFNVGKNKPNTEIIRLKFEEPTCKKDENNQYKCDFNWKQQNFFLDLLLNINEGRATNKFTYTHRAYFYGLIGWIQKEIEKEREKEKENENKTGNFKTYFRTLRNLIENTNIDGTNIYNVKESIKKLFDFIKNPKQDDLTGFDPRQKNEEKRKLNLIGNNNDWETLLLEAENHWYLAGQVGFLLDYAENKKQKFEEYWKKFRAVFDLEYQMEMDENPIEEKFLLRRALFTFGDYTVWYKGSGIWKKSMGEFSTKLENKNRSWRKIFRNGKDKLSQEEIEEVKFRKLLCDIKLYDINEENIKNYFRNKIEKEIGSNGKEWTKFFIKWPYLIYRAYERSLKVEGSVPYIFTRPRVKNDIFTRALYYRICISNEKELNELKDECKLNIEKIPPFNSIRYYDHQNHCISLDGWQGWALDIHYVNNRFEFILFYRPDRKICFKNYDAIKTLFEEIENNGNYYYKHVMNATTQKDPIEMVFNHLINTLLPIFNKIELSKPTNPCT